MVKPQTMDKPNRKPSMAFRKLDIGYGTWDMLRRKRMTSLCVNMRMMTSLRVEKLETSTLERRKYKDARTVHLSY